MNTRLMCAIPARAGSKRLPGKNLLPLHGKPMLAYSIEVALKSKLFDEVYVCTEDDAIAEVGCEYGATVPILAPSELCGDLVASHIPCQYVAAHLAEHGMIYDTLVCLQPTSPLRSVDDLTTAVTQFRNQQLDFLVSVTEVDPHYFHWGVVSEENEPFWHMYFGDKYLVERSLLPPVYRPNGSIKIAKLDQLKVTGHFFGKRLGTIETPEERSIHVATHFEFDLCEFLLSRI